MAELVINDDTLSDPVTVTDCEVRAAILNFLAGILSSIPTSKSIWGLRQIAEALGFHCESDWSLLDIKRQYTKLFVMNNQGYVAPYECMFRDHWFLPLTPNMGSMANAHDKASKSLVMGASTMAVHRAYQDAGMVPVADLPDHIANELRFMAYLWAKQSETVSENAGEWAQRLRKFRYDHVLKWIHRLRERVQLSDRLGFFSVTLQVAEMLVQAG